HSFLSGILADKDCASEVVKIVFDHLFSSSLKWHGIVFEDHPMQGHLAEIEKIVTSQMGMKWLSFMEWDRSILYPPKPGENNVNSLSKHIRKNYRRSMRGLNDIGQVKWEIVEGDELTSINVDDFIRLENMGWKGARKSSIYSRPNYASFFREMIENFNKDGRTFFTELRLDDQIIASTSNIISGNAGFAFKIGWELGYAKHSPGILNQLALMDSKENTFTQLKYIDSGSAKESFINYIWPEKRQMYSGVFIRSNIGKLIMPCLRFGLYPGLGFAKNIKHRFLGH
ncbi:MAG: GNAT family N-acetyltransferase, partial [Anaerolineales bacterium]|nr:GNAT family N-acetyltransferase [Anaerolineales bacterium]